MEKGSPSEQALRQERFEEMCGMYPLLGHRMELLAEQDPFFRSAFVLLDAETARTLEDELESLKAEEIESEAPKAYEEFANDMERCKVRHGYLSFHNLHRHQVMAKKRGHGTLKDAQ